MHAACQRLGLESTVVDDEQLNIPLSPRAGCGAIDVILMKFGFMFICTCEARYAKTDLDSIPGYAAAILLATNAKLKYGYWCIAKRGGDYIYEFRHIAMMGTLNDQHLHSIILTTDEEVSNFSDSLREAYS